MFCDTEGQNIPVCAQGHSGNTQKFMRNEVCQESN